MQCVLKKNYNAFLHIFWCTTHITIQCLLKNYNAIMYNMWRTIFRLTSYVGCVCETNSAESLGAHKFLEPCNDSHGFLLIGLQYCWLAWWAVPQLYEPLHNTSLLVECVCLTLILTTLFVFAFSRVALSRNWLCRWSSCSSSQSIANMVRRWRSCNT